MRKSKEEAKRERTALKKAKRRSLLKEAKREFKHGPIVPVIKIRKKRIKKTKSTLSKRQIEYDNYMKSKEWRLIRQKVLLRDDKRCTICGSRKRLHVHHITYKRFKKENLSDLITVCTKCHFKIHFELKNKPSN